FRTPAFFAVSDQRLHLQDGLPVSEISSQDKLGRELSNCRQRCNIVAMSANGLTSSVLTVDDSEDSQDLSSRCLDGIYRLESRLPGRDYIFDYDYLISFLKRAFDSIACAVSFCLFSDGERTNRHLLNCACVAYCKGYGICSHCQAANGIRDPAAV